MVRSNIIRQKESHRFGSKQNMKNLLFTPVRKFLRIKVRPTASLLGKRPREEDEYSDPADPVVDTPPPTPLPASPMPFTSSPVPPAVHASHRTRSAPPTPIRVALQNIDPDGNDPAFSDTVIVTTLDNIPFCCHEDLLTMSRSQLIGVAKQLNNKLPQAIRIEVDNVASGLELRKEIERIVGLSEVKNGPPPSTPGAPRVNKRLVREQSQTSLASTAPLDDEDDEESLFFSPPTSPLARRSTRINAEALLTPKLARLTEEDEDEDEEDSPMVIENRPAKRRRVFSDVQMDDVNDSPTPAPLRKPRTVTRVRTHRAKRDSPMPRGLLHRSAMDMRFVTTSRPTYRSLRHSMVGRVVASSPGGQSSPLCEKESGNFSMDTD